MSWNPFNRQSRRNILTRVDEKNFEKECEKMQHLEELSKRINKDCKKMTGSISTYGKSVGRVGHDLLADLRDHAPRSLQLFEDSMAKQERLILEKNTIVHQAVAEPMKKYSTVFPAYNTHLKSRDRALADYCKVAERLSKYEERQHTGANTVKLDQIKREMKPVKEEFERIHQLLMQEVPAFYGSRLDYLDPSLEALVCAQWWCHHETLKLLEESGVEDQQQEEDEQIQGQVNHILEEVRQLSITSDD